MNKTYTFNSVADIRRAFDRWINLTVAERLEIRQQHRHNFLGKQTPGALQCYTAKLKIGNKVGAIFFSESGAVRLWYKDTSRPETPHVDVDYRYDRGEIVMTQLSNGQLKRRVYEPDWTLIREF